jgi:Zn-dependent protease with chaperone function
VNKNKLKIHFSAAAQLPILGLATVAMGWPLYVPIFMLGLGAITQKAFKMHKRNLSALSRNTRTLPKNHDLIKTVNELSEKIGITPPQVFVKNTSFSDFNAASYHDPWDSSKSAIILSSNLFLSTFPGRAPLFNKDEARSVILHELLHIKNKDSAKSNFHNSVLTTTSAMTFVSLGYAALGVLPLLPGLIGLGALWSNKLMQSIGSVSVESSIDEQVVNITKDPKSYASALHKIHKQGEQLKAFADNAKSISMLKTENTETIVFEKRKEKRGPGVISQILSTNLLPTHPAYEERLTNIFKHAKSIGVIHSPYTKNFTKPKAEKVDSVYLPPFTAQYEIRERKGRKFVTALTSLEARKDFNKVSNLLTTLKSLKVNTGFNHTLNTYSL